MAGIKDIFSFLHDGGGDTLNELGASVPASGKSEWIFGRGSDCDYVVPIDRVSRQHFKIELIGGHYYISDLGSTNGTFLNGRPVERMERIYSGDVISMGSAADMVFTADMLE